MIKGREEKKTNKRVANGGVPQQKLLRHLEMMHAKSKLLNFYPQLGVKTVAVLLSIRDGGTTDQLEAGIRSKDMCIAKLSVG